MNIIHFIEDFQGMIGTLFGVIATLITTSMLNQWGKVKVQINNVDIKFGNRDAYNKLVVKNNLSEASTGEIRFQLELFNTSNSPKYLKEFYLSFRDNENNEIHKKNLIDEDTRRVASSGIYTLADNLEYINVLPKLLEIKKISAFCDKSDISLIKNSKNLVLCFSTGKGKIKEKMISKLN